MNSFRPQRTSLAFIFAIAFAFVACDSAGPSSSDTDVQVGFSTSSPSAQSSSLTTSTLGAGAADESLVLSGSNGTLQIDDMRLIVDEVELESEADSAEFESEKPSFLDLPLDTTEVASVVSGQVPPGLYNELEFEVEDAELDDGDDDDGIQALPDDIDAAGFNNWPNNASMVVVGEFTPEGDTARSFTTYFEAEIEVEVEMEGRSFEVGTDDPSRRLTIRLDPAQWFRTDGTVKDLSQNDYDQPSDVVEFEAEYEFESGISEIEFDD
jgi:hypothetical protein